MGHNQTLQYLIDNEQDARWGLTVNRVGFQHIDSDKPYTPIRKNIRSWRTKAGG